ncbi:hypothetical protein JCM10908_002785 [Rhodotorula pacifica]|uniref:uncharacterized protein n=1 Tax=Rhodotorula pacifica TaxID=1495444 RepID=UPI00316C24E7
MAASISLKLSRGDETRVLSLPVQPVPAWTDMAASIAERFQLGNPPSAVTYLDNEGDQITVSSNVEVEDMWRSFGGKSSASIGVVAGAAAEHDGRSGHSAETEKLLDSIRDALATHPSIAFDIYAILNDPHRPPRGPPCDPRHDHHGGRGGRGGLGGCARGRGGGRHGHHGGRHGPFDHAPGDFPPFPFFPPPPPTSHLHPHAPPPPPPFGHLFGPRRAPGGAFPFEHRHPHRHHEKSDSSESSDPSDDEGKHRRRGSSRHCRHHSRGHRGEEARRSRNATSPY